MKIELEISPDTIANLMISAIESGDPVTTASKGGWCNGINWKIKTHRRKGPWYADPTTWKSAFAIEVIEVDDEETGHETVHIVGEKKFAKGFEIMAVKFPEHFGQVMSGDTDAPCADIFLQCVLFGDEKYA